MSHTFKPFNACIYCGASECRLTDEHIIPFSLNGTLVLPRASCDICSDITKRFEQVVSRSMYGPLRIKCEFNTRRKKERPTSVPAIKVDGAGIETTITVPVGMLPTNYIALELPSPGILTGAEPSNMNPEMKLHIKGDQKEIEIAMRELDVGELELSSMAAWGSFCRLLAKIGHAYSMAVLGGEGYKPLLIDLILGKSDYLSHYVGGTAEDNIESDLQLSLISSRTELYLCVNITLLGRGRLPTYQAVAGLVTDPVAITEKARQWSK